VALVFLLPLPFSFCPADGRCSLHGAAPDAIVSFFFLLFSLIKVANEFRRLMGYVY
jgi:hypothetical protein